MHDSKKDLLARIAFLEAERSDQQRAYALADHARRQEDGRWTGAHVPFGYRKTEGGILAMHAEEAETVRIMFNRYMDSEGDGDLAVWLNESKHLLRGKPWNADRVRRVLTHPIVTGEYTVRGTTTIRPDLRIIQVAQFQSLKGRRRDLHRHWG